MVRNYKRKTSGPVYSRENLETAISCIKTEQWTYRKASAYVQMPMSTLPLQYHRCRNRRDCLFHHLVREYLRHLTF
jgi:hypothetical protein